MVLANPRYNVLRRGPGSVGLAKKQHRGSVITFEEPP